ncbi:uncharacterized protein G2W53_043824 [Senna tora]|uniref:Uncharacterized protein n=1 Tax=Senna tora TaxID=362788 RepID=A0A834SID7_9FABA|nr:uncharacterized protein G2W53_043824 [Senna tora]
MPKHFTRPESRDRRADEQE